MEDRYALCTLCEEPLRFDWHAWRWVTIHRPSVSICGSNPGPLDPDDGQPIYPDNRFGHVVEKVTVVG